MHVEQKLHKSLISLGLAQGEYIVHCSEGIISIAGSEAPFWILAGSALELKDVALMLCLECRISDKILA